MDELLEGVIHSQKGELEKRKAEFVDLQVPGHGKGWDGGQLCLLRFYDTHCVFFSHAVMVFNRTCCTLPPSGGRHSKERLWQNVGGPAGAEGVAIIVRAWRSASGETVQRSCQELSCVHLCAKRRMP